MIRMQIAKDNPHLEELQHHLAKLGMGSMSRTAGAMRDGAAFIQSIWRDYALGGSLPGVLPLKNGNRGYARGIKTESNGPFSYEISNESKIAEQIENGTDAFDMKKTHPYGPRSRVSKEGVPYLIIPFQWGTKEGTKRAGPKNIVPKELLGLMRNKKLGFKQSTVKNGTYSSPNYKGQNVERWTYDWGDRASGGDFAGTVEQKKLADGMVRFEQGEKGGKRYGGYFTFRIISANSPKNSWIKPATPPRHVVQAVADVTRKEIEAMVEAAIKEDLGV